MLRSKTEVRSVARKVLRILPKPMAELLRSAKRWVLNQRSCQTVFRQIARNNTWDGTESVSGPGSTMEATSLLRAALPDLLEKYEIRSFLDIPCGDAYWISQALPAGIEYVGADIVSGLIERNRAEKGDFGQFKVLDLVNSELPTCDLVMVRDCLIHLPNKAVIQALQNIRRSGARYLLTTTYPDWAQNIDIEFGGFRPVDLEKAPFCLPQPLVMILETEHSQSGKTMCLWTVADLPECFLPTSAGRRSVMRHDSKGQVLLTGPPVFA
uniref:class I SAM-dependent methyltransferase n=1 Tax=Pararhizobium sp. IMCC3301 TaxID=3067904 RepID=UPI0027408DAB|nr:class I SAM-dependent methyltransferase [Pararhizobium sp. IMCC3301]